MKDKHDHGVLPESCELRARVHNFAAVDVTPRSYEPFYNSASGTKSLTSAPIQPKYKLYCTQCGEVRDL